MKSKGLVALLGLAITGVCAGVIYRKHKLDKKAYGLDSSDSDNPFSNSGNPFEGSSFGSENKEDVFTEEEDDLDGIFD